MEYLVPGIILLVGLIALVVYVLALAVRNLSSQVTSTNEKLLILLGTRDGNEAVGRALVASSRLPKRDIPGVVSRKETEADKPKEKEGVRLTIGAI